MFRLMFYSSNIGQLRTSYCQHAAITENPMTGTFTVEHLTFPKPMSKNDLQGITIGGLMDLWRLREYDATP
jgi:hypothetical protein